MTKEELEKEAEDFLQKKWGTSKMLILGGDARAVLADFAEPREKQIEIDAEHIRALQKQNGELTDKVNDLEDKLANADYQLEGRDNGIRELEAQTEKMSEILLGLLWFEEHLDPYMYDCNDAQKGELLKPFDNARLFLEKYKCKKCKGEGIIKVGYNGWTTNPCPACEGKGYILRR